MEELKTLRVKYKLCKDGSEKYIKNVTPVKLTPTGSEAFYVDFSDKELEYFDYDLVNDKIVDDVLKIFSHYIKEYKEFTLITECTFIFEHDHTIVVPLTLEYSHTKLNFKILHTDIADLDPDHLDMLKLIGDVYADTFGSGAFFKSLKDRDVLDEVEASIKKALGMEDSISEEDPLDSVIEKIKSETKATIIKPKETLEDYICNPILKEELNEIKDFFENIEIYKNANVCLPKGILFKGPAGTGKTYAARCIAGSTSSYFMTCTASSVQGMYIGSGADSLKKIFNGARLLAEKSKKGVLLFIDEIDSFGSRESNGTSDEANRTLNQLLAEMSGIEDNSNVIVLAATNYPERLDSALTRSGRFGRQINIEYPEDEERAHLIKYYFNSKNMKYAEDVDYDMLLTLTAGLSPADIKEVSNEACILAIRNKCKKVSLEYINEAINKVITKSIKMPDKGPATLEYEIITAHECGHVVAEYLYKGSIPIKVTNFAYGDAGGFTQSSNILKGLVTNEDIINYVKILVAGRAAEEAVLGLITTGASNDFKKAKEILTKYYKYYNFEEYDCSKLEQIVLDKLNTVYNKVVEDFKEKTVLTMLQNLCSKLDTERTLYSTDIINVLFKEKDLTEIEED